MHTGKGNTQKPTQLLKHVNKYMKIWTT